MSNTLLPTAFATAISPSPAFATAIEPRASGMDVPAATTSVPMTTSGMPMIHPTRAAQDTMQYEMPLIHMIDMQNATP